MRIEVATNQLARLLAQVTKIVESRNTIPVLSCVLVQAIDGKLAATTTDLDIEITGIVEANFTGNWEFCVNAKLLSGLVTKIGSDEIAIESNDNGIVIKAGKSRFKLQTLPADDFPSMSSADRPYEFDVDLATQVAPAMFAVSNEETRYYLNGVYLEPGLATSTDGHRLAHIEREPWIDHPGIILPRKLLAVLPKGMCRVAVGATTIRVSNDGILIVSKLIDGTFPDYHRVIPKENNQIATVDNAALLAAVERVSLVSTERSGGVRLSVGNGNIDISVRDDGNEASDSVPCNYDGDPIDIGFNGRYLVELLSNLPAGEITIALKGSAAPALITSKADSGITTVLMPMRLQS